MTPDRTSRLLAPPDAIGMRSSSAERLLLIGLLAAAAALRLMVLEGRGLWFDEAFSVAIARLPVAELWRLVAQTDAHPPLYYLLLHFWLALGDTPAAIRSFSVLCGVLTVFITWVWARDLSGPVVAAAAAAPLGGSALAIQASVEARMYPLLALLAVTATYLLSRATSEAAAEGRVRRGHWVAYAGVMSLAFYVDYFAFLLLPVHLLYVALYHWRTPGVRRGLLLALAGAILAYGPWWSAVATQLAEGRATPIWKGSMPLSAPLNMVALSSFGGYLFGLGGYLLDEGRWSWGQLLLVGPFLALVVAGVLTTTRRGIGLLLSLAWLLPVAILVGASMVTGLFYAIPRYVSFVQPFFFLLLAQGILAVARRERRMATFIIVTTGILVLNVAVLGATYGDPRYLPYNWAAAARHVEARWRPGDGLLFYPQSARVAFGYYFTSSTSTAVTLYAPPWTPRPTRAALVRALPSIPALLRDAERVWVVLTEPTPPESREALLEAVEQTYRWREGADFRYVYVLLYERH